jgi:tetratricopeptide (TPR) repeat protein
MPAKNAELRIRQALGRAAACAKRGELEAAMDHAHAVLALDPRNEIALGMLAGVYVQLHMRERAGTYLRQVLEINPRNTLARHQLGLLQLEGGQPQAAIDTWAASLDDDDFVAHFHTAVALLELRRASEARPLLEHCAPRIPRNHDLYPRLQELLTQLRL